MAQNSYRENAVVAQAEADAATLDNVKERCLCSAAAWLAMAERQERVETARAHNRAAPAEPDLTDTLVTTRS